MEAIQMFIASRLELVYLLGLAVRGICHGLPFTGEESAALELAVCEAANNAIKHAYEGRDDGVVRLSLAADGTGILICVYDRGLPMADEKRLLRDLKEARSLVELPEEGLGLFLIRNAADSVDYKPGRPENVLVIRKAYSGKME
ncbi:MAG: ATP-binding protein [Desulfovibrionaceae bacterium]